MCGSSPVIRRSRPRRCCAERKRNNDAGRKQMEKGMTPIRSLAMAFAAAAVVAATLPAEAADLLKITVGQRGNWDTSISYLGEKAGIFKKHGIELEIIYTSGSGETL